MLSALLEGAAMVFFTFYSLNQNSSNVAGKYGGLADGGDFIFAVIIFLPSVKILVDAYQIGWGLVITVAGSVLFYMTCHVTISESKFMAEEGESYKNLSKLFTFPSMYFAFVGFVFSFLLMETGLAWFRRLLKERALAKIEKQIFEAKEKEKESGLVTMKQSEYKRKYLKFINHSSITCLFIFIGLDTGYAFAGEKGNDALVLDALAANAQNAVADKITAMMAQININYTASQVKTGSAPLASQQDERGLLRPPSLTFSNQI